MAFVAMGLPIANTLHHALVRHAICALHGEYIHVDEARAIAHPATKDQGQPAARDDAGRTAHEHDDCAIPVVSTDRALQTSQSEALRVVPASFSPSPEVALAEAPLPALRLYLIAPKNSPPLSRA